MPLESFEIIERKVIIRIHNRICETAEELLASPLFRQILQRAAEDLFKRQSFLCRIFGKEKISNADLDRLTRTLEFLTKMPGHLIPNVVKGAEVFLQDPHLFNDFVEYVYNYWRSFDRFIICNDNPGGELDKKPYRTFNATIGQLTHLIRGLYRDIQENITGEHPRIYRQVTAGAEAAVISLPKEIPFSTAEYRKLNTVSMIRQVLLHPPLILNPPMNKRSGRFVRVEENPLTGVTFHPQEWLCYPAKVGPLVILIYIHNKFLELGLSLGNLFQLAEDEDLERCPDAVYAFGVPGDALALFGDSPTVFYDDERNQMLSAAVPGRDVFGYFGYLKKMVLTLHNIIMMKRGKLPFHGALVRILTRTDKDVTMLFMGDTGAGKSETLEALRDIGSEDIRDLVVIADDMGSLDIDKKGDIVGYGTEIGAFLRLDDLKPGYALGQIDRAIIMSPNQVNARIILPVTSFENVIKGHKIDFIFYANNYDELDEDHPVVERFDSADKALRIFREGTVMSKGTTTSTGLVHSYFANIFGPPQYKQLHEPLAEKFFKAFFKKKLFVGQIRTRLGLAGWERRGPQEAAQEILKLIR